MTVLRVLYFAIEAGIKVLEILQTAELENIPRASKPLTGFLKYLLDCSSSGCPNSPLTPVGMEGNVPH